MAVLSKQKNMTDGSGIRCEDIIIVLLLNKSTLGMIPLTFSFIHIAVFPANVIRDREPAEKGSAATVR